MHQHSCGMPRAPDATGSPSESHPGMRFQESVDSIFNPIGIWQIGQGAAAIGDRPASGWMAMDCGPVEGGC